MKTLALIAFSLMPAMAQTNWVTLQDAREHAFSIDVPKNWPVHGGMFRLGPLDPRPVVLLNSPDGKSTIQIGDPMIPAYSLPAPRLGFTEGKVLMLLGQWPVVARYRTAAEYLAKYGPAHFGKICESPQAKDIHSTPNRIIKTPYPGGQLSAAEGYFVCTSNGQPMLGYLYAETWSTAPGAGAGWSVGSLGGFLAPLADAKATGEILAQTWKTMAFNPAWAKGQSQLSYAIANKSGMELRQHLAASQAQFEKNMNAIHQQGEAFNDVLTGTTHTIDTVTGQYHDVPAGTGGTQWINAQNTVKESAFAPGPGYHQLETVNH